MAGEGESGHVMRCPGDETCSRWTNAAGTFEQKKTACIGCGKCDGRTPIEQRPRGESDDESAELVQEIAELIAWDDAGFRPEWACYGFAHQELFRIWREAEQYVARLHSGRIQGFLLSWARSGEAQ